MVIWTNYFKPISQKAIMTTRIMNRCTLVLNGETCPPNSVGILYQKCQIDELMKKEGVRTLSQKWWVTNWVQHTFVKNAESPFQMNMMNVQNVALKLITIST